MTIINNDTTTKAQIKTFAAEPGDISGYVRDQNGKGLYSGFLYLDIDGKQISPDYFTDTQGGYHVTYPQYNSQNIFVQFYSTDEYEPLVISMPDLQKNPNVVLKTNGGGLSLETIATILGIVVSLFILTRKR